jgi:hypothetical protein
MECTGDVNECSFVAVQAGRGGSDVNECSTVKLRA